MPDDKVYQVGRFKLILPADHPLDAYQRQFRLYDRVLGDIAQIVVKKFPDATAIDIGANVGDTAALICRDQDVAVLCIEGAPQFLGYLRRNVENLPPGIEIASCFVGSSSAGCVSSGNLKMSGGTASLQIGSVSGGQLDLQIRLLADILIDHPRFQQPRLIKSDTDGSDFDILLSSMGILRAHRPILYFEYDPTFRTDGRAAGLQLITELTKAGYDHFLVYDNFGNLIDFVAADVVSRFSQLDRYLISHMIFGRQVYYLDVCACAAQDADIAQVLYAHQNNIVDGAYEKVTKGA